MKEFDENLHLEIMDYLHGRLDEERKKNLEKRIATDKELAKLVKFHQMEKVAVDAQLRANLNQQIAEWRTEQPLSDNTDSAKGFRFIAWTILLLLIAAFCVYFFNTHSEDSSRQPELPEKITPVVPENVSKLGDTIPIADKTPTVEKPVTPPESKTVIPPVQKKRQQSPNYLALAENAYRLPNNLKIESKRSIESQSDTTNLLRGIALFGAKKIVEAVLLLEEIDKTEETYKNSRNWLAHAYFQSKEFSKAASIFGEISKDSRGRTKARAEWYLLLSLLPDYQNNQMTINELLEEMTDEELAHIYLDEAQKLKEKLN